MTLMQTLLALALPPLLLFLWVVVQAAWRHEFGTPANDPDALAARGNCGQCGCSTPCEWRTSNE